MKVPDIILLPPNRVWRSYLGGKIIDSIQGSSKPQDNHYPEDWIASTTTATNKQMEQRTDEGLSEVEIDGVPVSLKLLMEKYPVEMVGQEHYGKFGANTQFLLKFLDSSIRLHLQAHPTISFAQKYLNSNSGKTEAYVILGIRDEVKDPYIYLGFQRPITPDSLKEIILDQDIERLLTYFDKIPIKPGDVFFVPGGLPHAIGEGVFMIEIMEPTDFVVRLEFERGGYVLPEEARFMGRDVNFAMDMVDFQIHDSEQIKQDYFCQPRLLTTDSGGSEYRLIDDMQTPCFSVNKLTIEKQFVKRSDSFYVGIVIKGNGGIDAGDYHKEIKKGDKFFIPHKTTEVRYTTNDNMEIVLAFPPNE